MPTDLITLTPALEVDSWNPGRALPFFGNPQTGSFPTPGLGHSQHPCACVRVVSCMEACFLGMWAAHWIVALPNHFFPPVPMFLDVDGYKSLTCIYEPGIPASDHDAGVNKGQSKLVSWPGILQTCGPRLVPKHSDLNCPSGRLFWPADWVVHEI